MQFLISLSSETLKIKLIEVEVVEYPFAGEIRVIIGGLLSEKEVTFIIDEKGNIKSVKKGIEFKQLPMKYRT